MRHYEYINNDDIKRIFYIEPKRFDRNSSKEIISHSLGTTLYMPATREKIAEDIINNKNKGLKSIAICLEDAIGDKEISIAETSLIRTFEELWESVKNGIVSMNNIPFIFIRVRTPEQMLKIAENLGCSLELLTGFIFPKFSIKNAGIYLEELKNINSKYKKRIFAMPILETSDVIYIEKRVETLNALKEITDNFYDLVLNIRIGATDFSNIYGIRRGFDINIYNIGILRDCISDIINKFGRIDKPYVISGPVWEYFSSGERIMKPQLRSTPFSDSYGKEGSDIRKKIIDAYVDGLMYEVILDKANGLWGKTIIHPSHIIPVQSLYAVTYEEYIDALSIIDNSNGDIGVLKSSSNNKMNEIKTHINWANKIMLRTEIYGVLNEGKSFTDLFYSR